MDDNDKRCAGRLADAIKVLHELHPRLELGAAILFLEIARGTGATQAELADRLSTTQASVSRRLTLLSDYDERDGAPAPLNLVRLRTKPNDRRAKEVELTAYGQRVAKRLSGILKIGS